MREHLHLYVPALAGVVVVIAGWAALSGALAARHRSRWRAVVLCLPLVLIALGYGLFWWVFFASPASAVQMHALRLTIAHFAGPFLPGIGMSWLAISAWLLVPLLRR
jgi:uncharacterized membrane protein